jgi:hypothetical protein
MKARNDAETSIGWQVERFAREGKKLKSLHKYLEPVPSPERKRDKGTRDVKRMFDKLIRKQEAERGTQ